MRQQRVSQDWVTKPSPTSHLGSPRPQTQPSSVLPARFAFWKWPPLQTVDSSKVPLLFLRRSHQYTIPLSSAPLLSPRESQNPTRRGYHLLWQFRRHLWKAPESKSHLVVCLPSYLSLWVPQKDSKQLPPGVTRPCRGNRARRASQGLRDSPGSLFQELTSRQGGWPAFTYSKSSVREKMPLDQRRSSRHFHPFFKTLIFHIFVRWHIITRLSIVTILKCTEISNHHIV